MPVTDYLKTFKSWLNDFSVPEPLGQNFPRPQVRKLIFATIMPSLKREGFTLLKNNNNAWRITKTKIDVLELTFVKQGVLPKSIFSVAYGCYYPFIPDINGGQFLYQIRNQLTPKEVDCQARFRLTRTFPQRISMSTVVPGLRPKLHPQAWHLDEPEERQALVLGDVLKQLEAEAIPLFNKLDNLDNWLQFLENHKGELGGSNSVPRNYLLGFTYKYMGYKEKAMVCLMKEKQELGDLAVKRGDFGIGQDNLNRIKIIDTALQELQKQNA